MERNFLKDQGLDDKQIDAVMAQHGKDIQQYKDQAADLDQLKTENQGYKDQIAKYKDQAKDYEKLAGDNADLKKQLEDNKAENEAAQKKLQDQIVQTNKTSKLNEALTRAGSYNNKAMMALIDMDSITFDDKGNIHGVDEAVKNVQKQFPQGFKPSEDEKPKKTNIHAGTSENPSPETPKDPKKMSLDEMQELYTKDPASYQAMFNK